VYQVGTNKGIRQEFDTVATSVYVKFTCGKLLQVENKLFPYVYRHDVTKWSQFYSTINKLN